MTNLQLLESSDIESVFKVEPPLKELKKGYGFSGTVLRNKIEDLLQCHICGKWKKGLSTHINQAHKMTTRDYRIKFQLPLGFPLVSKSTSSKMSKASSTKKRIKQLRMVAKPKEAWKHRTKHTFKYMKSNDSFLNKKGICEEQLLKRFLVVSDIVGREPTQADLVQYDHALWGAIRRRYGDSLNTFRKKHNFEVKKRAKKQNTLSIISALRKFYLQNHRIPIAKDFIKGTPCTNTIRNICGSFSKALHLAGFEKGGK